MEESSKVSESESLVEWINTNPPEFRKLVEWINTNQLEFRKVDGKFKDYVNILFWGGLVGIVLLISMLGILIYCVGKDIRARQIAGTQTLIVDQQPCPATDSSLNEKECPTEPCPPPVSCPECEQCPICPEGKECPTGTAISEYGKNPIFDAIRFDYNAYDIKHYFENEALKVADYLKNNKNKAVILYGNTDDKGNTDYNKKLAEKRVDAVRNYLVKHGINNNRIKSFSYGEHRSVYSNKTPEGRLKNRRVDFEIRDYPWQD